MCDVYASTGFFGVKHLLASFPTEEEALTFCNENNWEYTDENAFQWHLEIR